MNTPQHTPTPWDTKETAGGHQHLIWDENGKTIALVYTDANDAAFIVRAVNSHAVLVEALETWLQPYAPGELAPQSIKRLAQARAALKLAKGES